MKSKPKSKTLTITVFRHNDHRGQPEDCYWRSRHRNGKINADSGEGYRRMVDIKRSLLNFLEAIKKGDYTIVYETDTRTKEAAGETSRS